MEAQAEVTSDLTATAPAAEAEVTPGYLTLGAPLDNTTYSPNAAPPPSAVPLFTGQHDVKKTTTREELYAASSIRWHLAKQQRGGPEQVRANERLPNQQNRR